MLSISTRYLASNADRPKIEGIHKIQSNSRVKYMSHLKSLIFATLCNCFFWYWRNTLAVSSPVDFQTIANKKEEMNSNNFKHIFTPIVITLTHLCQSLPVLVGIPHAQPIAWFVQKYLCKSPPIFQSIPQIFTLVYSHCITPVIGQTGFNINI